MKPIEQQIAEVVEAQQQTKVDFLLHKIKSWEAREQLKELAEKQKMLERKAKKGR